jgi:branched-chain amino acid transport system substrate-binding protein
VLHRRLRITALTAAGLTMTLAACGSGTSSTSSGSGSSKTFTLAVVGPMTGDAQADGLHIKQGADLAAEEIDNAGGVASGPYAGAKIVIQAFDDTESVDKSVSIANQIASDDHFWAFLGTGFSDAAIATAPVLDRANVSYLSTYASSAKIIATPRHSVFVVPPTFPAYAFSAADRAYKLGYRKAGILKANAGFGLQMADLFAEEFTRDGGQVVDNQPYTLGDKNTQGIVAHIVQQQPDVVAMAGLTGDDTTQLKQLHDIAPTLPVVDTEAVLFSQNFLDLAGPLAEVAVGQTPSDPDRNTDAAKHLRDAFRAKYGTAIIPDPAAFTYEAVHAIAKALEAGPADRTKLADALHNVDIPDTGIGELKFDSGGARLGGILWYFHVKAGKFVFDTGYQQTAPTTVKEVPLQH